MLNAWPRSRCFPIGLDLGSANLRMLQLSPGSRGLETGAAAHRELPPGLPDDGPQRRECLIDACRDAMRGGRFRGRHAVVNLSHPAIRYKHIRLPKMSEPELARAVRWEAADRFGDEAGELSIQHINVGELHESNRDEVRQEVILIGIPETVINEHVELIEACGLRPAVLEVTPTALASYFSQLSRRSADQQTVRVVVDLGAADSRVLILRGCEVVFYRPLQPDAEPVRVASAAGEAGAASSARGTPAPAEGTTTEPPEVAVEDLAHHIDLCLRYYSVSFRGEPPEAVYLCGGHATRRELPQLLAERMDLDVKPVPALHDVDLAASDLIRPGNALSPWAVAAGLALRDLTAPDGAAGASR